MRLASVIQSRLASVIQDRLASVIQDRLASVIQDRLASVIQSRLASTGLFGPCERSVPVKIGENPDVNLNNAMELA